MERFPLLPEASYQMLRPSEKSEYMFEKYQNHFHLSPEELHKPLLDVGAHDGSFVEHLRTVLGNNDAYGVELFPQKIPSATSGMVAADGLRLPFKDGQFDIVLAKHYISMFHDKNLSSAAVEELFRVLSADGYLKFDTSTQEEELHQKDKYPGKNKTHAWFDTRSRGAQELAEFIREIEQRGYQVIRERNEAGQLIITIYKKKKDLYRLLALLGIDRWK